MGSLQTETSQVFLLYRAMAILWYNLLAFGEKREEREGLGIGIGERKERKGKEKKGF